METTFTINGQKYTMRHAGMGIWEIISPTGNSLRFATHNKAKEHRAFLEARK